ncbi:MAG TPA: class I SAM-dependent methyltransferase [Flavobacterium sp.]|nr:class I SAM-dependent methyltransferase [Flavobacterium sp.]
MSNLYWNQRYAQKEYVYGETPNEYLKQKLKDIPAGSILFPCEGEGRNAVYASKIGWKSTAFDQSIQGKNKAEILAKRKDVSINYSIFTTEEVDYELESFDALALIFAHFSAEERRAYHQKISSYLKRDGVLILEGFSKAHTEFQKTNLNAGGPKEVSMLFDLEELKADFEGFEFIEATQSEEKLNEGNGHIGIASVVRIYAVKK